MGLICCASIDCCIAVIDRTLQLSIIGADDSDRGTSEHESDIRMVLVLMFTAHWNVYARVDIAYPSGGGCVCIRHAAVLNTMAMAGGK
jgi:hypothetical protein